LTPISGCFDEEQVSELKMEVVSRQPGSEGPESMLLCPRKLQARFFAGDMRTALEGAERIATGYLVDTVTLRNGGV